MFRTAWKDLGGFGKSYVELEKILSSLTYKRSLIN